MYLVGNEINKNLSLGIEGLGIGWHLLPKLFDCGRSVGSAGFCCRRVNGSAKAPVSPSNWEHHQSCPHDDISFILWLSIYMLQYWRKEKRRIYSGGRVLFWVLILLVQMGNGQEWNQRDLYIPKLRAINEKISFYKKHSTA